MDALELLTDQHDQVDGLFNAYEQLTADEAERRREILDEITEKLVRHAAIEEQAFYPTVREVLPEREDEIEHDLEEHQEVKEILARLERMDADDAEFDRVVRDLITDIRHHVREEENDLFPDVRDALDQETLDDLGGAMAELYEKAPTHPHPNEPSEPPANVLAGPAAAAFDRVRDAIGSLRDR